MWGDGVEAGRGEARTMAGVLRVDATVSEAATDVPCLGGPTIERITRRPTQALSLTKGGWLVSNGVTDLTHLSPGLSSARKEREVEERRGDEGDGGGRGRRE